MMGCSDLSKLSIFSVLVEPCSRALILVNSEKHTVSGATFLTIWRYAESV